MVHFPPYRANARTITNTTHTWTVFNITDEKQVNNVCWSPSTYLHHPWPLFLSSRHCLSIQLLLLLPRPPIRSAWRGRTCRIQNTCCPRFCQRFRPTFDERHPHDNSSPRSIGHHLVGYDEMHLPLFFQLLTSAGRPLLPQQLPRLLVCKWLRHPKLKLCFACICSPWLNFWVTWVRPWTFCCRLGRWWGGSNCGPESPINRNDNRRTSIGEFLYYDRLGLCSTRR